MAVIVSYNELIHIAKGWCYCMAGKVSTMLIWNIGLPASLPHHRVSCQLSSRMDAVILTVQSMIKTSGRDDSELVKCSIIKCIDFKICCMCARCWRTLVVFIVHLFDVVTSLLSSLLDLLLLKVSHCHMLFEGSMRKSTLQVSPKPLRSMMLLWTA